jgi:hypothetical protein
MPFRARRCGDEAASRSQALPGEGCVETIARALLAQARELGFSRLLLDTATKQKPAQRLAEKLGFREAHRKMLSDLEVIFYERPLESAENCTRHQVAGGGELFRSRTHAHRALMDQTNGVLTPAEVAAFLRTDPANVRQLLDDGTLAGFKIAGEWRVLWVAVVDFLRREMAATQQEALVRSLKDPRTWARGLQHDPDLVALLGDHEFEEGTMGAFLKAALRAEEQERSADNILPFETRRPHGAPTISLQIRRDRIYAPSGL